MVAGILVVAVIVAGVTAMPALRAQAPTRLSQDVAVPARPTGLGMGAVSLSETWRLPAVALCVVRAAGTVETVAAGVRKVGQGDLVQMSDLFHLGSMTKAMTATMIGTLVNKGFLSWNMTMAQVFPALAGQMTPAYRSVTLEQLLTHTAGLPRYTTDPEWASIPPFPGTPAEQRQAFVRMLLTTAPIGPPGIYRYSNAGFAVAAAIAERVTAQSWEQLMQNNLFGPLRIHAAYGWPLLSGPDEPWGHRIKNGVVTPHDPADHYRMPTVLAPAGDVSMSIADYAAFARLHLAGLEGIDGAVGSSGLIQQLHLPILEYSCGWHEQVIEGIPTSWHRGTCDTFDTFVLLQPSRDVGIIAFTNADGDDAAAEALFAEMIRLAAMYAVHWVR